MQVRYTPDKLRIKTERDAIFRWLCGELNSKNDSGGYLGFKRFIANSLGEAYLEDHGYVGKPKEESCKTDSALEDMDARIAILDKMNNLCKTNGNCEKLPAYQMEKLVKKDLFEKKWATICAAD